MANIYQEGTNKYLIANNRIFLQSEHINVFPCSRRGQSSVENTALYYDPEARLNTERTNRISTAINGFKNSFIDHFTEIKDAEGAGTGKGKLIFVLAGYRIEISEINLLEIAKLLGSNVSNIYAHLGINPNVSLQVGDYYTELLYRQSTATDNTNYLDVKHTSTDKDTGIVTTADFFVGVSFSAEESVGDISTNWHNLHLFTKNTSGAWELVQTSLLPKIDHDVAEDSVIMSELHVSQNLQVDSTITVGTAEPNGSEEATDGDLIAQRTLVPYSGSIEGFDNTKIDHNGVSTAYIRAGNIKADGIAVGSAITIVDEDDNTLTTVHGDYLSTVGYAEIDKYINVGEPTNPTTTSGDIVVKHDITAENDIIAKQKLQVPDTFTADAQTNTATINKLQVDDTANITGELVVEGATELKNGLSITEGDLVVTNSIQTTTGNLTVSEGSIEVTTGSVTAGDKVTAKDLLVNNNAKVKDLDVDTNIDTATLSASERISTPTAWVETTLNVQSTDSTAVANIDKTVTGIINVTEKAIIKDEQVEESLITSTLAVRNTDKDATASIDILEADQANITSLVVDTITSDNSQVVEQLLVQNNDKNATAKIDILLANTVSIGNDESTSFEEGTLKATNKITAPTLIGSNTVETPTLKTNTITSDSDSITVDKSIEVATGNIEVIEGNITAAKGTVTTKDLNVTGDAAIANLEVEAIKTPSAIITNTLYVDNIDKVPDTAAKSLAIEQATTLKQSLEVWGEATFDNSVTFNEGLDVAYNGEVTTPTLNVDSIHSKHANATIVVDAGVRIHNNLTVTDDTELSSLKVGKAGSYYGDSEASVFGKTSTTDLYVAETAQIKKVSAESITAGRITQNGKAVPFITVAEVNGNYQLQITTDAGTRLPQ